MRTTYAIIRPGTAAVEQGVVDWPAEPDLDQLWGLIRPLVGDDPEHVYVTIDGDRRGDMFVHGSGSTLGLPRDEAATLIYRAGHLLAHPQTPPETMPWICGTAVLFARRVWF